MISPVERPWIAEYLSGVDPHRVVEYESIVHGWKARVATSPERAALRYFDGVMTAAEVDRAFDALAAGLVARGTNRGDRVGIYLQNVPQCALTLLALWKLRGTALLLNPLYNRSELRRLIDDSGAIGIICGDTAVKETPETLTDSTVRWLISTSARDFHTRNDPGVDWVYLVDRFKDQINVSGYKIWAREVKDVLYEHPAVHEVAVVGQPDEYRGETVVAFVSLKSGTSATEQELIAFTKERLAAYKYPRAVHIIGDLPKTQTGKIRRRELRDDNPAARLNRAAIGKS